MVSKKEQELLDRLKATGRLVHYRQTDSAFKFMIRPFTTAGVPSLELAAWLEEAVFENIAETSFDSPITAIVIFPSIFDKGLAAPPGDYVKYNRNERSVFVGKSIEFGLWTSSTRKDRLTLLASNVKHSLGSVPNKYLLTSDRQRLLVEIDECTIQLGTRLLN